LEDALGDQGQQHHARLPFSVTSYGASPSPLPNAGSLPWLTSWSLHPVERTWEQVALRH
jgi:hypothetical protein